MRFVEKEKLEKPPPSSTGSTGWVFMVGFMADLTAIQGISGIHATSDFVSLSKELPRQAVLSIRDRHVQMFAV